MVYFAKYSPLNDVVLSYKGVLYMSELGMGLPLLDYYTTIIRSKVGFVAEGSRGAQIRANRLHAGQRRGDREGDDAHCKDASKAAMGRQELCRFAEIVASRRLHRLEVN
nr:enoyl-CoA delta isomerase 2, peroxisomal-like [Ipomoea batatas]